MGKPMDYGSAAPYYAIHRWALPWKLDPLVAAAGARPEGAVILEIGCGTGDYLAALHEVHPKHRYHGFDISPEMLLVARARCPWAELQLANAEAGFPADDADVDLVYAVDVLHHLENYDRFFAESARVLRRDGHLVAITDAAEDLRDRTLAQLFPTTVAVNMERYPSVDGLVDLAARLGLRLVSRTTARGHIEMDERIMGTLAARSISELRLIPDDEYREGVARAEKLRAAGETWLSQTTVLDWTQG